MEAALKVFLEGIKAAVSLHKTLMIAAHSQKVQIRTGQCVLLATLLLGSTWLSNGVITPALDRIRVAFDIPSDVTTLPPHWTTTALHAVDTCTSVMMQAFWFLPIYLITLILSTVWFQDIAEHAYVTHHKSPPVAAADVVSVVSEELYRLVVIAVLLIAITVASWVPVIGRLLGLILTCWTYSFYSFEYVWTLRGVDFAERVARIETHWAFFLGFGAPITLAAFFGSQIVNAGVYSLCILVATVCQAPQVGPLHADTPPDLGVRLPIFRLPKRAALLALKGVARVFRLPLAVRSRARGGGSASHSSRQPQQRTAAAPATLPRRRTSSSAVPGGPRRRSSGFLNVPTVASRLHYTVNSSAHNE